MRSKHSIVRMFTAFTAEPAKSYNMLVRAMMSGSKKKLLKTVFLTTASAILASAAAAFISAGRDDDDYKTFWEKYLETFGGDILDSVNPLSSIPFMSELLNRVRGSDYDTPEFYEQAVENTQSLLDYIADKQLGDGSRYSELAKLNGKTAAGVIHPGDVIKLP